MKNEVHAQLGQDACRAVAEYGEARGITAAEVARRALRLIGVEVPDVGERRPRAALRMSGLYVYLGPDGAAALDVYSRRTGVRKAEVLRQALRALGIDVPEARRVGNPVWIAAGHRA